ncbi:MAG: cysteine--tRNA ligase [Rhizobiales bacterium]|nr:cysteine--tRNA ligase [Hyphomicrobiales bacterium]
MSIQPEIRLYNTLTRTKERFTPIDASNVRMYVCGPTVYDYAHIGNARPIIVFDVLFRLLRHVYGEDHVKYVRNITDVDDKINARAAKEGVSIGEVTQRTTKQFHKDIAALGVLLPSVEPRATDHIVEMRNMIDKLIANKHAYVKADHVLFNVASMPDYGKFSNRSLEDMIAGARVDYAPYKDNQMDFVLWKPSKEGEPSWDSPAGITVPGRPGWHIECSAMAEKHLGKTFDIHGGGIDLTFPHHENEIAQSRCTHGTDVMANVWMHNGFVQVEGEKMSKSVGNFITIHDLLETNVFGGRRWPGEVLRLAMLMTGYRKPINWTTTRLHEAEVIHTKWRRLLGDFHHIDLVPKPDNQFIELLSNDLETDHCVRLMMRYYDEARACQHSDEAGSIIACEKLLGAANLLGIHIPKAYVLEVETGHLQISGADADLNISANARYANNTVTIEEIQAAPIDLFKRIERRLTQIETKDWASADEIRANLLEEGIKLLDMPDPESKGRTTKWEPKK